jgi:hypothetical protein
MLLSAFLSLLAVAAGAPSPSACENAVCWVNELSTAAPAPLQRFVEVACTSAAALDPATLSLTAVAADGAPAGAPIPLSACLASVWAPPFELRFWVCDSEQTALDLTAFAGVALLQAAAAPGDPPAVLFFLALAPAALRLTPACVLPAPAAALLAAQALGSLQLVNLLEGVPAPLDNTTGAGIVALSALGWHWSPVYTPGTDNSCVEAPPPPLPCASPAHSPPLTRSRPPLPPSPPQLPHAPGRPPAAPH